MKQTVLNTAFKFFFITIALLAAKNGVAQTAPELVFRNPVLKSGTANKEGAIYKFSNITAGVDAELKLKKFSRPDIVMNNIDLTGLGWDKALQPEFGLPGRVQAFQNWYIDFELRFYKAGTSNKQTLQKAVFTALDVDGDNLSVNEYTNFENPSTTAFSRVTALAGSLQTVVFGSNGESLTEQTCPVCADKSIIKTCGKCNGTGVVKNDACDNCDGGGKYYGDCKHPYAFTQITQGPVTTFTNIDTAATQVMVTYTYLNKDKINFRYGGKSGASSSVDGGVRLNSLWAKQFSLAPVATLPVKFAAFSVIYDKTNALLNWDAPHGDELNYFLVQRSTDGRNFNTIATVFAGTPSAYAYKDKEVASETSIVYYRIVSVDQANAACYSAVKTVRLTKLNETALLLSTFPNPAVNNVNVTLPASWQGKQVNFQVIGADGNVVRGVQTARAAQTETLSLAGLQKGMYFVSATCGSESAKQRLLKN